MKTKEEAIKEAWGKNYPPSGTDKNGWLSERHLTNAQCYELNKDESLEYNNVFGYRPKSLQGIENNNGWIRIESEDDLPKYGNLFWVIKKGYDYPLLENMYHDDGDYWVKWFTHYKKIDTPKKPLY